MMKESVCEPFCIIASASVFEPSIGSKRAKAMCAAIRKTAEVSARLMVAARCLPFNRRIKPTIGPIRTATAASPAGSLSAANDAKVKSKKWDIESV